MQGMKMDELDSLNKQNIKYYDTEASTYDARRYKNTSGQRVDSFQKEILGDYFCELPNNANILELGCGTGRFLPFLSKKGFQLTGIDISTGMLEVAKERIKTEGISEVTLIKNEPGPLLFYANTFDAIYSILVINLIKDYQNTFQEVARILKPGGLFVFSVPNLSSIYFPVGLFVNQRGRTTTSNASGYRYSHWFTKTEIRKSLKSAGLAIEEVRGQPFTVTMREGVSPIKGKFSSWLFSKSVYIKARKIGN